METQILIYLPSLPIYLYNLNNFLIKNARSFHGAGVAGEARPERVGDFMTGIAVFNEDFNEFINDTGIQIKPGGRETLSLGEYTYSPTSTYLAPDA
jgi:hypothetical protein